jgi:superfamily II DNA or RNA helicase
MSSVKEILSKTKFRILDFHQNMVGGKDETLEIFSREGGIMLAIKCLDEGVDIPQINKAIILASSSNPREYIQRRGRVLRKTENKYEAKIWDILVTKQDGKLISVSEAIRALEFAKTSTSMVSGILLEQLIKGSNMEEALVQIETEIEDED